MSKQKKGDSPYKITEPRRVYNPDGSPHATYLPERKKPRKECRSQRRIPKAQHKKTGRPGTLPKDEIEKLWKDGNNSNEIATLIGATPAGVWKCLQTIDPKAPALALFRKHQADILSHLRATTLDTRLKILARLDLATIDEMAPETLKSWYAALATAGDLDHKAERLERGKSTTNISSICSLIERLDGNDLLLESVDNLNLPTDEEKTSDNEGL